MLWGTRTRLTELFGLGATWIKTEPREFNFRYRSAQHFIEVFRTYYGPMLKAFSALDMPQQNRLEKDLYDLIGRMNKADDGNDGRAERIPRGDHRKTMKRLSRRLSTHARFVSKFWLQEGKPHACHDRQLALAPPLLLLLEANELKRVSRSSPVLWMG